jgi:hypothetical protein
MFMEEEKTPLQRLGGHLLLLVIASVLFASWRTGLASSLDTGEQTTEGSGLSVSAMAAAESTPTPASVAAGEITPVSGFGRGELPVISDASLVPGWDPHELRKLREAAPTSKLVLHVLHSVDLKKRQALDTVVDWCLSKQSAGQALRDASRILVSRSMSLEQEAGRPDAPSKR